MKMLMHHVQTPPVPPSQRTELRIPPRARRARAGVPREGPGQAAAGRRRAAAAAARLSDLQRLVERQRAEWWRMNLPDLAAPLTFLDEPSALVN